MTIVYSKLIKRVTSLGNEGTKRIMHNGILIWPLEEAGEIPYLTFTCESIQTFTWIVGSNNLSVGQLFYSTNKEDWFLYQSPVLFGNGTTLYIRGTYRYGTYTWTRDDYGDQEPYACRISFENSSNVSCSGDIRTLMDWENYNSFTTLDGWFAYLFRNCTLLLSAPDLPFTTLSTSSCFYRMFGGCRSLTLAPLLPATTLSNYCYYYMFADCSSLIQAPLLPATLLKGHCYAVMFGGCSILTLAPLLPATTLASYCYHSMFQGCYALTLAPDIIVTTMQESCCLQMFSYCRALTLAPLLPATTLAKNCYTNMFSNCSSLEQAPVLPATSLAQYCYEDMFRNCSSLNYIKMMARNINATNHCAGWVQGVSSSGTFVKNSRAYWSNTGIVPSGWTVQTASE